MSRNVSGADMAVVTATATHAPVKRLSQQSSSGSGGYSPSALSVSVPAASRVSSYAPEDSSAMRSISPGPPGGERLDYLLLGQEEYLEHHSEITHCKFATSGSVVASSDVDGVLKVWTPSPSGAPTTQATFISQNSVTALEWIPNSERHFLYGTRNGIVRLCDRIERRTMQGTVSIRLSGSII